MSKSVSASERASLRRDFKASCANGGPGWSGFDRRIYTDGLWCDLSIGARRLYACGFIVLERNGTVEATQRELAAVCGLGHATIIKARAELESAGLIAVLREYSKTGGHVVQILNYAPSLAQRREERVIEKAAGAADTFTPPEQAREHIAKILGRFDREGLAS